MVHIIQEWGEICADHATGERARARGDLQKVFQVDSNRALRRAAGEAMDSLEKG